MQYITTVSEKGQVVVPKKIRDKLNIKAADTVEVRVKDNVVVITPTPSTDQTFGMFKARGNISKTDIKNAYRQAVTKKRTNK